MDVSKHLPGNPFDPSNELGENVKTAALMAVAFELRTANMIAAHRTDADFPHPDWRQIKKRLGTE